MFFETRDRNNSFLSDLARAYEAYESAGWNYFTATPGPGGYNIDRCAYDHRLLRLYVCVIGSGLQNKNKHAEIANKLLIKLFTDGFKGGRYKEEIQEGFRRILPANTFERLKAEPTVEMEFILQGMYAYKEQRHPEFLTRNPYLTSITPS